MIQVQLSKILILITVSFDLLYKNDFFFCFCLLKNQKMTYYSEEHIVNTLKLINSNRSDQELINVGRALYDWSKHLNKGFQLWLSFLSTVPRDLTFDCQEEYEEFKFKDSKSISARHLQWYAANDNPTEYKKLCLGQVKQLVETTLKVEGPSVRRIAELFYYMHSNDYIISQVGGGNNKDIYEFQPTKHRWVKVTDMKIEERLRKCLDHFFAYPDLNAEVTDETEIDVELIQRINQIKIVRRKLGLVTFKKHVVDMAIDMIKVDSRISFNINSHLVRFKNGVYDHQEKKFRPGRPEDLIEFYSEIEYHPIETYRDNDLHNRLMKFLENQTVADLLKQLKSDLFATDEELFQRRRKVHILTYTAKSELQDLFHLVARVFQKFVSPMSCLPSFSGPNKTNYKKRIMFLYDNSFTCNRCDWSCPDIDNLPIIYILVNKESDREMESLQKVKEHYSRRIDLVDFNTEPDWNQIYPKSRMVEEYLPILAALMLDRY